MKKFYKQLGIVFVMAFAIMIGCLSNNVFAADNTLHPIHKYTVENDKESNIIDTGSMAGTNQVYDGIANGTMVKSENGQKFRNFNGKSDKVIFKNNLIPLGDKSFKFKVRTTQTSQGTIFTNINNINGADNRQFSVYIQNGKILFRMANSKNQYTDLLSKKIINDNNWHSILITYDINNLNLKLFIDNFNIPDSEMSIQKDCEDSYYNQSTFGFFFDESSYCRYFEGDLDDIEIYNDVLQCDGKNKTIVLNKSTDSLQIGQTDTLTTTITPDNVTNKNVVWKSSDESIATVDQTGKVIAVKEGTATITATTTDGSNLSASCVVTVMPQGTTPTNPTDSSGSAILNLTMTNGNVKSYTVSMSKVNDFISWYNNRAAGSNGSPYYTFDKTDNLQPFSKKTEYVVFDKISSFEVDEYTKQ